MDIEQPQQQQQQQPQQQIQAEQPQTSYAFVLPGESLPAQLPITTYSSSVFMPTSSTLIPLYSGFPTQTKSSVSTLLTFNLQYVPNKNDLVIGVVKIKTADNFIVDIGAPLDSILGGLQFDGVTKRNKPNLKVGTPVFCRVLQYSKYTGGKLSCMNKIAGKKNNQLGQLKQGYIFWLPEYKHQIIQKYLLERIGKCVKFQVAFGKNGRIWINSSKLQNTMLIYNMFKMVAENADQQKINAAISMLK